MLLTVIVLLMMDGSAVANRGCLHKMTNKLVSMIILQVRSS